MSDGIAIAKAGARDERGVASAEDASAAGATMRPAHEGAAADAEIVTIRPGAAVTAAQRLPCYVGVS